MPAIVGAARGSTQLGAPNSGARLDLRLGPHLAMSPCFFSWNGLAVVCKECNSAAKSTTTSKSLVLLWLKSQKTGGNVSTFWPGTSGLALVPFCFDLSDEIDTLSTQIGFFS